MSLRGRDLAAAAVVSVATLLCVFTMLFGVAERGFTTRWDGDRVVVDSVLPGSTVERFGVHVGQVVVDEQGRSTLALQAALDRGIRDLVAFIDLEEYERRATRPADEGFGQVYIGRSFVIPAASQKLLLVGLILLAVGIVWLRRQPRGSPLHELALPLAAAVVVPLLIEPARATETPLLVGLSWIVAAAAVVPLGVGVVQAIAAPYRRLLGGIVVACAGVVVVSGLARIVGAPQDAAPSVMVLLAATAGPGLAAAAIRYTTPSVEGERGRIVPAVEFAVAGLTPAVARLTAFGNEGSLGALVPLAAWFVLVAGGLWFAVRPLLRVAARAGIQRDIVVAAMEAERARLAADIHDDALQDLTMLVRRFDAAGDAEGAAAARHVADRLRAICGDLRLPILDDLGAGPALEWLVERVERLAGGEVRLERGDDTRPPADVELAFFRVAQEALANAVKHGRPPIIVRYRTTPSGASLSVDDAGAGIDPVAARGAAEHGRFGMLNMIQRAEQIGAILDVRRWPKGGTHVALEWRAR